MFVIVFCIIDFVMFFCIKIAQFSPHSFIRKWLVDKQLNSYLVNQIEVVVKVSGFLVLWENISL